MFLGQQVSAFLRFRSCVVAITLRTQKALFIKEVMWAELEAEGSEDGWVGQVSRDFS